VLGFSFDFYLPYPCGGGDPAEHRRQNLADTGRYRPGAAHLVERFAVSKLAVLREPNRKLHRRYVGIDPEAMPYERAVRKF
jgi:hypothetical protein